MQASPDVWHREVTYGRLSEGGPCQLVLRAGPRSPGSPSSSLSLPSLSREARAHALSRDRPSAARWASEPTSPPPASPAQTAVTAPAPRERADRGDGQVRRRPHRELRGRDPRPAGNEPRAHRPSGCRSSPDPGVRTVLGDPDGHDRPSHPPNGAGRAPPADVLDRLRRGLRFWCRPGRSATYSWCRAWSRSSETVWPTRRQRPLGSSVPIGSGRVSEVRCWRRTTSSWG